MNSASVVALLNGIALVTIMLAMGMQVKFEAVMASVRPVHRVALGLIANYGLVPVVTVGLLYLFQAEFKEEDVEGYDPFRKVYIYGDEDSAAKDMAFIFFQVWRFPVDWEHGTSIE